MLFFLIFIIFLTNFSYSQEFLSFDKDVLLVRQNVNNIDVSNTDYRLVLKGLLNSCEKFLSYDNDVLILEQFSNSITVSDIKNTCDIANNIKNKNLNYLEFFFKNYFTPYLIVDYQNDSPEGIFTGYYLPKIKVKKTKDFIFRYPLYKRPNDLVDKELYYTRKEINKGILENKNLELFYTDDVVDLYFLQVQGSGFAVDVETHEIIKVGFNGKNNHDYTSIGKALYNKKLLGSEELNSVSIKKFLKNNIDIAESLMDLNKSYVFFKILEDDKIIGSHGVELVNNVSLAVDKRYIPLGFPMIINTNLTLQDKTKLPLNKIMITHDTGSAIKGVVRGDIFFGDEEDAEQIASYQHSTGVYYILIPLDIEEKLINSLNNGF